MIERWINRVLMVAAIAIVLICAGPALAQEAEEAPDEGQMTEEEKAIEEALARQPFAGEITVTSRRREEKLQEIPIAVSVITGENLQDITATDISEMQKYVPNLAIYAGRNQSSTLTAFVRGIGQADPLWGVDPGVGLYIDDVYLARPQGTLLDVYDVERVEVLRGPQGTLYGKNTIGGAIKYVTRPLSDTPEGKVTWNPGTYNTQELRASIAGPLITGKLRGKASFAWLTRDGYGENRYQNRDVSDKNSRALRLGLEWLPTENLRVRFDYDRVDDEAEPKGLTRLQDNPLCPLFIGTTCPPYDEIFDTESGLDPANSYKADGYSMTWTWDVSPSWQFKSITAYRDSYTENNIDFDTTSAAIADVITDYWDDQMTQEFQLVFSGSPKWAGVMGLYYFHGTAGGLVNSIFFEGSPFVNPLYFITDGETETTSYAFYGEASYRMSDRWTLNFGIRPTREEKRGIADNGQAVDGSFEDMAVQYALYDKSTTFTSWAPKIGVDYQVNPDLMLYGKVNQGFKSGGWNVRAQTNFFPESGDPFQDEVLTMGEIGIKSTLANRSLVLNAALFYGDYTDVQVSTFTSYDSTGDGINNAFYGVVENSGDATNQGIEVEYNWASKSWFGLSGFLAYLDATPDTLIDNNGNGLPDTQVISNAPKYTGTLRANFDWPAFGGLLTASAGYTYRDDAILTTEEIPITQDAYGVLDAWIMWLSGNAKWRFGVSGKNLTDTEYLETGYQLLSPFGILQGSYGAPREFVATLEFRFF